MAINGSGKLALQMLRMRPFVNKATGILRGPKTLHQAAIDRTEINPTETEYCPGITMLEHDINNVVKVSAHTTLKTEKIRIAGGRTKHSATVRLTFAKVLATPNGFYTRGASLNRGGTIEKSEILFAKIRSSPHGHFSVPNIAMAYFGHWVNDALTTSLLTDTDEALYLPSYQRWPHTSDYLKVLDIPAIPERTAFFDKMSFYDDRGQNSNRRARLKMMQEMVQSRIPQQEKQGVFIRRGNSGASRELINEEQIAKWLSMHGFTVCSSTDPLPNILNACAGADIVVSIEGSHLAHALFAARTGALFVTLNPADQFNNVFVDYMSGLGSHMATLVARREDAGYRINPDDLMRLIDKGLARRSHPTSFKGDLL